MEVGLLCWKISFNVSCVIKIGQNIVYNIGHLSQNVRLSAVINDYYYFNIFLWNMVIQWEHFL